MARCLSYFNKKKTNEVTVLVATSGDTGGAVASGFLGVKGVNVVILYPSGKVSEVQEKQLTTLGQNIKALEVDGTFDDCQAMVKKAFIDQDITEQIQLTSANSINVARWLPQMFYFAFAYKQLKDRSKPLVFSTPSGNFGNICAGFMAQQLGLPVSHFIAYAGFYVRNDLLGMSINHGDDMIFMRNNEYFSVLFGEDRMTRPFADLKRFSDLHVDGINKRNAVSSFIAEIKGFSVSGQSSVVTETGFARKKRDIYVADNAVAFSVKNSKRCTDIRVLVHGVQNLIIRTRHEIMV